MSYPAAKTQQLPFLHLPHHSVAFRACKCRRLAVLVLVCLTLQFGLLRLVPKFAWHIILRRSSACSLAARCLYQQFRDSSDRQFVLRARIQFRSRRHFRAKRLARILHHRQAPGDLHGHEPRRAIIQLTGKYHPNNPPTVPTRRRPKQRINRRPVTVFTRSPADLHVPVFH